MGKRRLAQVAMSDDEEESNPPPARSSAVSSSKKKKLGQEEEEEEDADRENEEDDEPAVDLKPLGKIIKVSGKGRDKKNHYTSFELDGNVYELEDPVLLTTEAANEKPYVAIIKDITQAVTDGSMAILGQWFYRPEEAEKKGAGSWQACDTRELFYSFHRDEVPAEAVMHKCVVHFVPLGKQLPIRSQHPGFVVRKVYDTVEKKLWKLTDKDYEDSKQHEIDLLVQKTRERLGELPDLEVEEGSMDHHDDDLSTKKIFRRKPMPPINVSRDDDMAKSDQLVKTETPGSCTNEASEFYIILSNFKVLTGDSHRDKSLEKLLQAIHSVRDTNEQADNAGKNGASNRHGDMVAKNTDTSNESQEKNKKVPETFHWPDDFVYAITSLEKASHDTFGSDLQKYNQKMRQLVFNLKNNLARRLLGKELEPSVILNMSPAELKEGLTAEEKAAKEPQQSEELIQMTDARCKRCTEKKVRVSGIITVGHGDRYQLECLQCGNTWYATPDSISMLTQEAPNVAVSVGTAPWATAKFEDIEKKLVSPRESEKPSPDIFQKSKSATLETQKSFNSKPRTSDASGVLSGKT